jgi:DNA repair protein RAD5
MFLFSFRFLQMLWALERLMTISLILANPGRGGMDLTKVAISSQEDPNSLSGLQLCLQEESSIQSTNQIKDTKRSRSSAQHGGGTLIVCPMTLLGQWKVRFQTSHQSLSFTCRPGASCGP